MALLIMSVSSGLLKPEPIAPRALTLSAWNYLKSGPVSLAFAIVIVAVEVAVVATGTKEQLRSEFGLPNDNAWAYIVYAFLHHDITHLLENAGTLLICGGIVEERMKSRWLLVLAALSIPLGGYLTTLIAPVFIDSPWTGDLPSVGFSIVDYAVLVLCSFFVIDFVLKERFFKLASEKRKRLLGTAIVLLFILFSFISGVGDGPGESILGHSVGIVLGALAGGVWWVAHRSRPPAVSGMSVPQVGCQESLDNWTEDH